MEVDDTQKEWSYVGRPSDAHPPRRLCRVSNASTPIMPSFSSLVTSVSLLNSFAVCSLTPNRADERKSVRRLDPLPHLGQDIDTLQTCESVDFDSGSGVLKFLAHIRAKTEPYTDALTPILYTTTPKRRRADDYQI